MSDETQEPTEATPETPELQTAAIEDAELQVRSMEKREIEAMIVPWNVVVDSPIGPEMFLPGSFAHVNPGKVIMRLEHDGPPSARGISLEERSDGPHMVFRVSKTQAGDDLLTLAQDGVTRHVSVAYYLPKTESELQTRSGRRVTAHKKVDLREVVTTWKPYYEQAAVLSVRSKQEDEVAPVSDSETKAPETGAPTQADASDRIASALEKFEQRSEGSEQANIKILDRLEALEERGRSAFVVPGNPETPNKPKLHEWASVAARMLVGGSVNTRELQERALQDVISPDNPGQIPEAFVNDILGIVQARRPFLASTTQIAAPSVGLSLTVPVFDTHSTVGVQSEEKSDIASTAMKVTTDTFDAITIAGGADVSIQLIRRGEPSFFDLLLRDLGAAYAAQADLEAISALLGAGVTSGAGDLDPENLMVGDAWANSISAIGSAPDHVWLSSAAVAEFIDAKDNGTNRPLYFNLNANFAAGTGTGGNVSALQPVYTPALDSSGVDVLIGPASAFVWAEDGTFQLQVDVPSKAGRDIAVVGILFLVPRYPAAFTSYALTS